MSTAHPHTPAHEALPEEAREGTSATAGIPSRTTSNEDVLHVVDLSIAFPVGLDVVRVVDDLSLRIPRGKVVALVGESGCGKSLTALSILRLLTPPAQVTAGQILFQEETSDGAEPVSDLADAPPLDLLNAKPAMLRAIRGNRIAMVFQEPMTSLNPVLSIGNQISEAILLHRKVSKREAWTRTVELLQKVEIACAARRARDYPHQFSGGMRQRVMIAMAIANNPALLIADEPTTALDVTTQRQVLDLLAGLQRENGMSVLLITHDLGVVAEWADLVYVMYAGRIVEHAPTGELLRNPLHPYTQGLLECTPTLGRAESRLPTIPGVVPEPARYPTGCRFHPRCKLTQSRAEDASRYTLPLSAGQKVLHRCTESIWGEPSGVPGLEAVSGHHFVACWEVFGNLAGRDSRGK